MHKRDRETFIANLYSETVADLRRYLRGSLGSIEAAEDVAQETYSRLITMSDPGVIHHPRAFLFKAAGRLALNYLRQSKRRHYNDPKVIEFDERYHGLQSHAGPELINSRREALVLVSGAVEGMTDKTRLIFSMHRFEEKTYGEIADHLKISRKTVEYHMSQALRHLMFQCGDLLDLD
jgi:RNA polymerase sigma-70 factor (ECF subfamily)